MNWDDRENKKTFIPCDYCNAYTNYPANEHGNNTACEHCDYAIILHCLNNNVQKMRERNES